MELLEQAGPGPVQRVKPLNIKKLIVRYLKKWPWFLLSMALFYTAAKIYLRYTAPEYYSQTTLKLQKSEATNSALSDLKNLGMGVSGDEELQAETTVIVSKPILSAVAKNLNLEVSFYSLGKVIELELYGDAPVTGKILRLNSPASFMGSSYTLSPAGRNSFQLSGSSAVYRFGTPVKVPFGIIQIDGKAGMMMTAPIKVVFKNLSNIVGSLEGGISVSLPPDKGMLMELSMVGPVPQKSEDILNELTRQYLIDGVKDKNEEARNTQNFINDRLAIISEDLSGIEGEKEGFKRANQIVDLESQANMALTKADENTKLIVTNSMQLDLVNSVLGAAGGEQVLPSGLGLPGGAETTITEYNSLLLTRNRVLKQATGENPAVIEMNKQLASLKNMIRRNLMESRETLQLQIAQANAQLNVAKGNISRFPTQEKVFRSIDRQQTLKEQLYLYLLQKREENAITLAVTAPKAKIVNPAFTTGIVKPNYRQIIYGSLAAGFLLPLLILVGLQLLDTKIHTKEQVLAQVPDGSVIGEIPENHSEEVLVQPSDFSVFAESFRIMASNLKFLLKPKESEEGGVILVTSSVKGEGKTTISMNLALTLAGKSKTLIIGADIRSPQLHRYVKGRNVGLTDYLISRENVPDQFIIPSGISEHLDVLLGGQLAPNPNDLLDMVKFDDMIAYLRTRYEFIILDSAPVMLVGDTLQLIDNSDVVLYVAKSNFTDKEMIDFAAGFRQDHLIRNMAFVLNGVRPEDTRYGSSTGYGYYSESLEDLRPWYRKLF